MFFVYKNGGKDVTYNECNIITNSWRNRWTKMNALFLERLCKKDAIEHLGLQSHK